MAAEDVSALVDGLSVRGVDACIGGGWALDAVLCKPTRTHSDLDV